MDNMNRRIGVYICHCGSNIAGIVDVSALTDFARGLPSVVVARDYKYMCSDPGQDLIRQDIKELGLNRVVVAACSPQMHELTFRKACESAGLNKYLLSIANIREHCSWVTEDHEAATEKAKALVSAAVRRVYYQEPLHTKEVPVNPNTLVVGGGIAGIQAALEIANSGHKVYLIEREPSIGGHMIQFDKTFPSLDCSACILTPKMSEVGSHPNIELMSYSEVIQVSGYVGNFKVKVKKKARYVDEDKCTGCGRCQELCPVKASNEFDVGLSQRTAIYIPFAQAVPNKAVIDAKNCRYLRKIGVGKDVCRLCQTGIERKGIAGCETGAIDFEQADKIIEIEVGNIIVATGYDAFDPTPLYQYGYGHLDNVITALEFERMINASGPTGGKLLLKNGSEPKTVGIIHCVGSRDTSYHEYCSQVCCMYSMKFSHLIREHIPGAKVYEFYVDLRAVGKAFEEFYNRVLDEGTIFIRGRPSDVIQQNGKLAIQCEDTLADCQRLIPVDMVVLSTALQPRSDAEEVARLFGISRSADGFFLEKHPKLDPVATMTDGIYVVGCCQSPKDITSSVVQASAGAARVLALISKGTVTLGAVVAHVDETRCLGCGRCEEICEFHAPKVSKNEKPLPASTINEVLCKGCGACAVTCPTGAISIRHFTREQVLAEVEALAGV